MLNYLCFFHFSLTLGFSLSIALFAFEMMTFLAGITMFIASVSLLCIFFMRTSFLKSIHQRCSIKKAVLNNFAIFTGEYLSLQACNENRIQHRCFPVNIAKFLRTPIVKNIFKRLLLIFNDLFCTQFNII